MGNLAYELVMVLKAIREELHIANLINYGNQVGRRLSADLAQEVRERLEEVDDGARAI